MRTIKIGARKSHLAKIQALSVGKIIKKKIPDINISYYFSSSQGDKNISQPLWEMPNIGVFTKELQNDLINQKCDLIVHSWKDLPTKLPPQTMIAGTLKRADMRDLLILKKYPPKEISNKKITILSSSPRRIYNLSNFLPEILPFPIKNISFESVRGNILTRIKKLLENNSYHGLILAKAAIDRLLLKDNEKYLPEDHQYEKNTLFSYLKQLNWMVLPLSTNPTSAAQGALAIEILKSRKDLLELIESINHKKTFNEVQKEREILSSYGGGCHQKIGINILQKNYGKIMFLRGFTEQNEALNSVKIIKKIKQNKTNKEKLFPLNPKDSQWFDRIHFGFKTQDFKNKVKNHALLISKYEALPKNISSHYLNNNHIIWTSGVKTWKKLAKKGVWVHGCYDNLGENNKPEIDIIGQTIHQNINQSKSINQITSEKKIQWIKLTHKEGVNKKSFLHKTIPTYKLKTKKNTPGLAALKDKTHFYWMSGSSFKAALKKYPGIINKNHSCGAGNTYQIIKNIIENHNNNYLNKLDGNSKRKINNNEVKNTKNIKNKNFKPLKKPDIFLNHQEWLDYFKKGTLP